MGSCVCVWQVGGRYKEVLIALLHFNLRFGKVWGLAGIV